MRSDEKKKNTKQQQKQTQQPQHSVLSTHNKENHGGNHFGQGPQAQHIYAFKHTFHVSRSHLFDRFDEEKKQLGHKIGKIAFQSNLRIQFFRSTVWQYSHGRLFYSFRFSFLGFCFSFPHSISLFLFLAFRLHKDN